MIRSSKTQRKLTKGRPGKGGTGKIVIKSKRENADNVGITAVLEDKRKWIISKS